MAAYYNEIEPFAVDWLRGLIKEGIIADGEVDSRSIADVTGADLAGFTQCHFFAGIGGWSYALRLAGWPDNRPVWTGSCPCQPFSDAGKKQTFSDARHLWPQFRRLIAEQNPPTVFGEQVASKDGVEWADRVAADFEASGYAFGTIILPASSVGAPHQRDRFYFVADALRSDPAGRDVGVRRPAGLEDLARSAWAHPKWKDGGYATDLLDDGVSAHVSKRTVGGFGNAIVPQVAAEFVGAFLDTITT